MTVAGLLDTLLAAALLVLALRVLLVRDLFHAVVTFLVFGLLLAMTWVRVAAPDVALAEAGIGAALTGVLLLDALHNLDWRLARSRHGAAAPAGRPRASRHDEAEDAPAPDRGARGWRRAGALAAAASLLALLVATFAELPAEPRGLAAAAAEAMPRAGVDHPVTAVLLNFRSLDTLLELAVLLVAFAGVLSLRGSRGLSHVPLPAPGDSVTIWLLRILLPLMVMVAGYLVWLGTFDAGGAFQAGVVLAGIGVFLWLTGRHSIERLPAWLWQVLLLAGLVMLLLLGSVALLAGRAFLEYPPGRAEPLIILLEVAAALSIGSGLTALFVALHPPGRGPGRMGDGQ
jgi:multisubunit Na+/H+ antiporter MnhB subunit